MDSFWFTAEGDFKDIQELVDNPRLKDKFIFIGGTAVNFIKVSLTKHANESFITHALYYDRESSKVWMNSITEFINLLKDEVKGVTL